MRRFLLRHRKAPGDLLVFSALVRDIALTYPEQYAISLDTSANELWTANPYVTSIENPAAQQDIEPLTMDYGPALNMVHCRNRHFLLGFHEDFEYKTGIHVPLRYPRPDYHLTDEEKAVPLFKDRYWVVLAGGKTDFVTKHWSYKRWQQLINVLRGFGLRFVQVGAVGRAKNIAHIQPILENVYSLVGLTTLRDLGRLIYHADGVICPVTATMHFAAALQKPCVVIGGGREEWWWEAYVPGLHNFGDEIVEDVRVPHRYLHTLGTLDCCGRRGCWRNQVTGAQSVCKYVEFTAGQHIPRCMNMITVNHVVEAVMSYYEEGILPPIGTPRPIIFRDGRPYLLKPGEESPPEESALVKAMTIPEPILLERTEGMRALSMQPQKQA
jgi:hypothetical protein